jgi:hypothetical protein
MFITGFAAVALKTRNLLQFAILNQITPWSYNPKRVSVSAGWYNNAIVMVARSPALETDRRRCRLAWFGIGPGPVRHLGPKEVNG